MKIETFRQRLQSGKGVSYHYRTEGKIRIIGIWRYEGKFVLTWEEFVEGDFYNEQSYTRDETHHFKAVEEVLEFLKLNKVNPRVFKP